ncbi:MAG: HPr family phosphocarrier protein [Acidobacteria bacterium]|nr:HPr family phosphocarrier protein [Acidobacteriota bacterium]
MHSREAVVRAAVGLHARPAAMFVRAVTACGLPVTIGKPGHSPVDARSLLEVMMADFACGSTVVLGVSGDAPLPVNASAQSIEAALDELAALLETGLTPQVDHSA